MEEDTQLAKMLEVKQTLEADQAIIRLRQKIQ
jgi:hypothetical protein